MRSIVSLFIALISISSSATVFADVTFSVDLDLATPGIQSGINVVAGDTITGSVVLEVSGASRFSAYNVILDFEQDDLDYGPNTLSGFVSDTMTGNRDVPVATNRVNLGASGLISIVPLEVFDLGPLSDDFPAMAPMPDLDPNVNSLTGIAAGGSNKLGAPAAGGSYTADVFEFTLTAIGEGTPQLTLRGGDPTFLEEESLGLVSFVGAQATITAVPEPSTWAMLGIGTLLYGRRKLRQKKSDSSTTASA